MSNRCNHPAYRRGSGVTQVPSLHRNFRLQHLLLRRRRHRQQCPRHHLRRHRLRRLSRRHQPRSLRKHLRLWSRPRSQRLQHQCLKLLHRPQAPPRTLPPRVMMTLPQALQRLMMTLPQALQRLMMTLPQARRRARQLRHQVRQHHQWLHRQRQLSCLSWNRNLRLSRRSKKGGVQ